MGEWGSGSWGALMGAGESVHKRGGMLKIVEEGNGKEIHQG